MPVTYICNRCASRKVTHDAWAEWDVDRQQWVLGATFDYAFCHACEQETRPIEIELAPLR